MLTAAAWLRWVWWINGRASHSSISHLSLLTSHPLSWHPLLVSTSFLAPRKHPRWGHQMYTASNVWIGISISPSPCDSIYLYPPWTVFHGNTFCLFRTMLRYHGVVSCGYCSFSWECLNPDLAQNGGKKETTTRIPIPVWHNGRLFVSTTTLPRLAPLLQIVQCKSKCQVEWFKSTGSKESGSMGSYFI